MKYPDFGKCKEIALKLAEDLMDVNICYGVFTPLTPKESWDDRWANNSINPDSFIHFWLEDENKIIDGASRQFGESSLKILDKSDIRYKKVGHLIDNKPIPITSEIEIQWFTLYPNKTVNVIWPTHDEYLKGLGK